MNIGHWVENQHVIDTWMTLDQVREEEPWRLGKREAAVLVSCLSAMVEDARMEREMGEARFWEVGK